jgi:predicted nucleic acid-binding protein
LARPCVLDASLLIALGKAGQVELLRKIAFEWRIGPITRSELVKPETKRPVEEMILDGVIQVIELDSDDERGLELFSQWSERVDPGEAESIALALRNGWLVGIEDLAAQRKLDRIAGAGHWVNCASLLIASVKAGTMRLAEADALFASLDVFGGYAKSGIRSLSQIDPEVSD